MMLENQLRQRSKLKAPGGETNILLHSCCAPCAGDVMAELKRSNIHYTILFYNPNIHPIKEYEIRKMENKRFADCSDQCYPRLWSQP